MTTILYPFRNREIERIKNSLDSLKEQSNTDFEVILVESNKEYFVDLLKIFCTAPITTAKYIGLKAPKYPISLE